MRTLTSICCSLFVAVLLGCSPAGGKCTPSSCTGCCDASGMCQAGNSNLACGSSGAVCSACQGGASCSLGVCSGFNTGGGAGSTGGGSGSTGGGGGMTSSDPGVQFCLDVTALQIALYGTCGEYTQDYLTTYRTILEGRCSDKTFHPGYRDGRVRLDPAKAQACLSALRAATCTITNPIGYESCSAAFVGLVTPPGSCYSYSDCVPTAYCDISVGCPGRCAARKAIGQPVAEGESCALDAQDYGGVCTALVPLGQSCAPTGGVTETHWCESGACDATETCVPWMPTPRQSSGQPCNDADLSCGVGLRCTAGVCEPKGAVGAACDSERRCKDDLYCGPANTCVTRAAAGGTCSVGSDCGSGLFCNRPTGSMTGTCALYRTAGQTCTGYSQCASDLICTFTPTAAGVCRQPYAIGETCLYNGEFGQCGALGYCTATSTTAGVCANKKAPGATCANSVECQGSCASGRCTAPSYCFDPTP